MRIKFTLQRPAGPVDLIATVDSATTVGDLATYLVRADPSRSAAERAAEGLTLGISGPSGLAVDPRLPVADSGLRSGGAVSISRPGSVYTAPHRAAAATVRILDGPDAGKEFTIPRGTTVIGRDRGCDIRLADTMVSRQHARLNVTDVVEIVDMGSANGVQIEDLAVSRSVLRGADVVQVGDTRLSVRTVHAAGGDMGPRAPLVGFIRSPRLDPLYEGVELDSPEPPERPVSHRFQIVTVLAPLLMGGVLYIVTRSLTSILFVALSPLMLIGTVIESRIGGRAAYKQALAAFWADVDTLVEDAAAASAAEVVARRREHPSTAECVDALRGGTPLLWARRPDTRGFAEVRLGTGRLPARNTIAVPRAPKSARAVEKQLAERVAAFAAVDRVPVVAVLRQTALGVGGPRSDAVPVARALVAQVAALHSPTEMVIAAVASTASARDWEWLKWLPHTSSPSSPLSARHLASSSTQGAALVSELEDVVAQRQGVDVEGALPAVLLLVEGDAPIEYSRLVAMAEQGPAVGVHVVWLAAEVAALPAACRTYIEISRDGLSGAVGFVHTGRAVTPVILEVLDAATADAVGHLLAPVVDLSSRIDDASDLPRSVALLAINGTELAALPEAVLERWTENRSIVTGPCAPPTPPKHSGGLRAVIGQSASEVHALDLRVDGPHALVGGTTGAGKSELLQAWILAMAAAHSPQRLTFLLVDYKGGSAFRDCVALPHTVGLVTDLSQHLMRRALTSLSAELRYREHILAQHSAKDLVTLEKQGVPDAPPSLVIVVDEFAALVSEVPEFLDGVVNVAQRGRSLGLHLILATQRPAGVIKDNLRGNTNLRLALRMADEGDSSDVLGSPEAAFFDPALPGRAVSKTGPGRLVPFQTGYAGGWTTDQSPPLDILVEELAFGLGPVWEIAEPQDVAPVDPGPTDIRRLVDNIRKANAVAKIEAPRKPWLPELKPVYDLTNQADVPTRHRDDELVFAVRDDPNNQDQPVVAFYPDREGNLAVYGTGGSGKSTLLRTLAAAAGFTARGGPCHVYGIDFGTRGLAMLEDLPHVGSIMSGGDHERITRLLEWLRGLIDDRAITYSKVNAATITDYREIANAPDEPRILLLLDGVAAFRQAYESSDRLRWLDVFSSIASDGRPVGIHVILSSDQRGGLTTTLASAVQSRVVLRLASPDDYSILGVPGDVLGAASPPGRGLVGEHEAQVAVMGGRSDVVAQALAVKAFADAMRKSPMLAAEPIGALPGRVELADLPVAHDGWPVVGLASTTLGPLAVEPRGSFLVSGPPGSGRTTALVTLATALKRWNPAIRMYCFGRARSPLAGLDLWVEHVSRSDAAARASDIAASLADRQLANSPVAVFIEDIGEFAGGAADMALQELAKVVLAEEHLLVAEGESTTLSSSYGLLGYAKTSRSGLSLQPDQGDGTTIYRTNFPRINRAEFPPGRAMYVRLGRLDVAQVATTEPLTWREGRAWECPGST